MSTQEESSFHQPPPPSDRNFGWVFTCVLTLYAILPLRHHQPVRLWAAALATIFLLFTLIFPSLLHPLNQIWSKVGLLLGKIVNPIVMGILFFLIVTPMGLFLRLMGKDLLRLSWDGKLDTYWIERRPPGPDPQNMTNQF